MDLREKFIDADIPYDELDIEMIEILDILNFQLDIKTQYCCYGHKPKDLTYIMFEESQPDENIIKLLEAIDNNLGTSGVKNIKLYKWARTMYQPYYKKPWYPKMNWMLEIGYVDEVSRGTRLKKVTEAIRKITL